ncbi:MAG: hypothetical protein JSW41_04860 [Candidatus Aenigmatarchaeota archaeon]|nr:MAG: hypothetical protein JSW41_04860 [Candidatus Aenigmarchaeota archaeon]
MVDDFYKEQYKKTHTWPRGLKAKLIRLDGNRCFFCHGSATAGKPLVIHHFEEDGGWSDDKNPYLEEHKYNPRFLVLLCHSCHGKAHRCQGSPFERVMQLAFKERKQKIIGEFE